MANRDVALLSLNPINLGGSQALANLSGTSSIIRPGYSAGYAVAAANTSPSDASYIRQPPVPNTSPSYQGTNPAGSLSGGLVQSTNNFTYDPFNNGGIFGGDNPFGLPDDGGFFDPIPGGLGGTGGGANGGYNGTGTNGGGSGGVVPVGAVDDAKNTLGSIYDFIDGFFFGGLLPGGVDFRSVLTAMIGVILLALGVYALIK